MKATVTDREIIVTLNIDALAPRLGLLIENQVEDGICDGDEDDMGLSVPDEDDDA